MGKVTRFRSMALVACVLAVILSGCAALRLQNDQRRKVADEAAKLAETLRSSETDPFAAMEDGIGAVAKARKLANDYLYANRKEAFLAAFSEMTREELAEELMTALSDHLEARSLVDSLAQRAAEGVKTNLKRQAAIQGMEEPADSKIETVLAVVEKRLQQVTKVQANIGEAMSSMKGTDSKPNEAGIQTAVAAGVTNAKEFIKNVGSDPLVQESSRLLLQAGQDLAASEKERLKEMRRHLDAMQAVQKGLTRRDELYPGELFLPTLILVASDEEYQQARERLGRAPASKRVLERKTCRQKNWADAATLAQFVEKSLADAANPTGVSESCTKAIQERFGIEAGKFIGSLGVILFDENIFDSQQAVAAAAELHLHSVRLSRINSRQRIDLVGQVTEALRIYYQGGVTPQQAAQMVLMAANVLATGAIATQL